MRGACAVLNPARVSAHVTEETICLMNTSLFLAYLATATLLMLTPGPDMLFCVATGMRAGPRAGLLAALGAATGEVVHISAAAGGLAALFRAAPALFDAFRAAGAAYLIFLGIRALRRRDESIGERVDAGVGAKSAYVRGLATNLLNPKMALFTIAFLPQFIDPHAGPVAIQFLLLGGTFVALEIIVDGSVGMLAGRLAARLRSRRAQRTLNVVSGSVLLGLGVRVATER
jgi:threonine/homoserine/homoserine lactone efflux protein